MAKEEKFADVCNVDILEPNAGSRTGHIGTVRIDVDQGDGLRRAHLLFYEDGALRLRINEAPMAVEEAFLTGNPDKNTIVRIAPRRRPVDPKSEETARRIIRLRKAGEKWPEIREILGHPKRGWGSFIRTVRPLMKEIDPESVQETYER
jgi:hypothetical protein